MSRDLFKDNLITKLGQDNFLKFQSVVIGIAGCGGLGSNVASNLVRSGFKNFVIVDFDKVEEANLDRQFYFLDQVGSDKVKALRDNLLRINPDLNIKPVNIKIEKSNVKDMFKDCDIVAECLDRAEYKSMLVRELITENKFLAAASGLGGVGSSDDIKIHRVKKNFVMIGDLHSDISKRPAISPRVNIVAAKQADVILEYCIADFIKV